MDDLQRLASHVTGCGRVQTVYERLMTQVRSVLKKTDAEGYDVAMSLVKAHDDSMRLLQLHTRDEHARHTDADIFPRQAPS